MKKTSHGQQKIIHMQEFKHGKLRSGRVKIVRESAQPGAKKAMVSVSAGKGKNKPALSRTRRTSGG